MQFERLRKSHKKQIIIGAIAICVIGGALTFSLTRAKYKIANDLELAKGTVNYNQYDFKIMAMYKSEDGSNYIEITDRMPSNGYVINEEKSYCTLDNVNKDKTAKLYTESGKHIFENLAKNDKCYLYFDKKIPQNVTELIASLNVKDETPNFANVATTDEGVFKISDGMYGGTSYYWRGAATTNYLKFANFCWRVVRINGDSTIRIIYDGTTCHQNGVSDTDSIAISNVAYNLSYNKSYYVGWTYGTGQRTLSGTASNAKTQLEGWFNKIIGNNLNKVSTGFFCNDRNIQNGYSWSESPSSTFYYDGNKKLSENKPTLSCNDDDIYKLKVATITLDEVLFAGGNRSQVNQLYYLYNGKTYWTMTPFRWTTSGAFIFRVNGDGSLNTNGGGTYVGWTGPGLRPVINLRSDITFSGGDGTLNNPYVVS